MPARGSVYFILFQCIFRGIGHTKLPTSDFYYKVFSVLVRNTVAILCKISNMELN